MKGNLQKFTCTTQALYEFAETSSVAMQLLKHQHFECIVIDIDHIDRFAPIFIKEDRNQFKVLNPIHIVTASKHRFSGLVDQLHKAGANAFFQKPCDIWDTFSILANLNEIDRFDAVNRNCFSQCA